VDMLDNKPVDSCYDVCWKPEQHGLHSRRTVMKGYIPIHSDVDQLTPTLLDIILGSTCNLTCSYCCKQYSTAWFNDIESNGPYMDDPRFIINSNDLIVKNLSQNKIKNSDTYQLIIDNVLDYKELNEVVITGGEPFLYNSLIEIVNKLDAPTKVFTGLGVNSNRFKKILEKIPSHVTLVVSAENIGELYEFNRYGNSYRNLLDNLEEIKHKNIKYRFASVISNLTIHGFYEFQKTLGTVDDEISFCTVPPYLSVNVLDDTSKNLVTNTPYNAAGAIQNSTVDITTAVNTAYSIEQKEKLELYLKEFSRRRQLNLGVFPESFRDWLNIKN
jgi:organic radical activating enzyme